MNITKTALRLFTVAILAITAASCNDSSNEIPDNEAWNLVTFAAQNESGSTFTFQTGAFTPEITLTSTRTFDTEKVKVGTRMVIRYRTLTGADPNTSGPIDLLGFMAVHNAELLKGTASEYNKFASEMVEVNSVWITGKWLNFDITANVDKEPKTFKLVADESTLDSKQPTVYLLFETDDIYDATAKRCYASFDIDWLWKDPRYTGITLKVANGSGPHSFEFEARPSITPMN